MGNLERPAPQYNEPDRIIGTIRKNARAEIAISLRTYKGHRFVDVREMAPQPDGKLLSTGKGVTMKADALLEIIELLQKAKAEAIAAGWCGGEGA